MASPVVAMVSAAERYARILNAFSPLISSRSAISEKICAIDVIMRSALEGEVDQAGAAGGERLADGRGRFRRAETEQAAATPGAADFGGGGPGTAGARDQLVDERGGHAGGQALAVVPLLGNGAAGGVPVAAHERPCMDRRSRRCSVVNVLVAIMCFGDPAAVPEMRSPV